MTLDRVSVHSFPADAPTSATLIAGPITDLNVMSRRGSASHRVQRINVMKRQDFIVSTQTVLFVENGSVIVRSTAHAESLYEHDALLMEPTAGLILEAEATACIAVIGFW